MVIICLSVKLIVIYNYIMIFIILKFLRLSQIVQFLL